MPGTVRFLCLLMLLFAFAGCGGKTVTLDAPPQALTVLDATGLTARPGETPEEIILRAHEYDMTAAALLVAGFSYGIGGFPKNIYLGTAYLDSAYEGMGQDAFTPVTSGYLGKMAMGAVISEPLKPDEMLFHDCKAGKSPLAENFKRAGIFDLEELCPGEPVFTPENKRCTTGRWDAAKSAAALVSLWSQAIARVREMPLESLIDAKLGESLIVDARLQAFLAASSHDPEYERPVVSREKLLALARIHAHETNCAIRDGAVRYLNDTAPEAREAALIRIRAALGGDPEAMRAMADWYANGELGFPKNPSLASMWRREAETASVPQ